MVTRESATDVLLMTGYARLNYQIIPDVGLLYVAGSLRRAGLSVDLIDARREGLSLDALVERARRRRPPVVGIKSYSNEAGRVHVLVAHLRAALPDAAIILGGPHPSSDPEGTLALIPEADAAFIGEAERSAGPFVRWLLEGRPGPLPDEVRGVAFRRADGSVEVRPADFGQVLDELPMPAWDLAPPSRYPDEAAGIFVPAFPAAPVVLSRGCPYPCTYCGCHRITGKRIRYRSVPHILEEIDLLQREYGVKTFTFVDDNFTHDRDRAMELFQALAARRDPIHFTFPNGVRLDSLDAELLRAMERAGCYFMGLGIESGSDAVLRAMRKHQTVALVEEKVALIRETTSIGLVGFFIMGYPGETRREVMATIDLASRLPIHHAHFSLFIPIPGTQAYDDLVARGAYVPSEEHMDDLTIDRPSMPLSDVDTATLHRLHQYAYFKFYRAPWRIVDMVKKLRSPSHLKGILRRFVKLFV